VGELVRDATNLPAYAMTAPDLLSMEPEKYRLTCCLFRQAPLTRNCLVK